MAPHNQVYHNLHSSSNIREIKSRRTSYTVNVARMGDMRKVYKILVGKPQATTRKT